MELLPGSGNHMVDEEQRPDGKRFFGYPGKGNEMNGDGDEPTVEDVAGPEAELPDCTNCGGLKTLYDLYGSDFGRVIDCPDCAGTGKAVQG